MCSCGWNCEQGEKDRAVIGGGVSDYAKGVQRTGSGGTVEETVFIDDAVRNLDGAAALGITPILIAANPASDVETDYLKIHDLRELIR